MNKQSYFKQFNLAQVNKIKWFRVLVCFTNNSMYFEPNLQRKATQREVRWLCSRRYMCQVSFSTLELVIVEGNGTGDEAVCLIWHKYFWEGSESNCVLPFSQVWLISRADLVLLFWLGNHSRRKKTEFKPDLLCLKKLPCVTTYPWRKAANTKLLFNLYICIH